MENENEKLGIVKNALEMYLTMDTEDKNVRESWERLYLMPALDRINDELKPPGRY